MQRFENWWKEFHKNNRMSKKEARDHWNYLRRETRKVWLIWEYKISNPFERWLRCVSTNTTDAKNHELAVNNDIRINKVGHLYACHVERVCVNHFYCESMQYVKGMWSRYDQRQQNNMKFKYKWDGD